MSECGNFSAGFFREAGKLLHHSSLFGYAITGCMNMDGSREHFASRIGFIFMTAGCAVGLGNVWRFPFITGQYGGGLFVLLYFICLLAFGIPLLLMELAIGRAGQSTLPGALRKLRAPSGRFPWHRPSYVFFAGNMILLMFYVVVTGWLLHYSVNFLLGNEAVFDAGSFGKLLSAPGEQIIAAFAALILTVGICFGGVQKTVETSVKYMMGGLFALLVILMIQAFSLPGAAAGVKFFLTPDLANFAGKGFLETLNAAMGQAFFTLSVGIGSIAVCGSYFGRERSLFQEGVWIIVLDTVVAVASGLIIFPSCISYGIKADSGPDLIFVTLPKVFQDMEFGFVWGVLFFVFLSVAALSTLIAVFENLVAFGMDEFRWSRKLFCVIFGLALAVLCLPCIFGFNIWSDFHPLGGSSTILDLEDFIVSSNLLPLGGVYLLIFSFYGWGADNMYDELNAGKGWKFPVWMKNYIKYVIPVLILLLWGSGIWKIFK